MTHATAENTADRPPLSPGRILWFGLRALAAAYVLGGVWAHLRSGVTDDPQELAARVSGFVLQLIGAGIIVRELSNRYREHGFTWRAAAEADYREAKEQVERAVEWVKATRRRLQRWWDPDRHREGGAHVTVHAHSVAHGHRVHEPSLTLSDPTLEQRVALLERRHSELHETVAKMRKDQTKTAKELRGSQEALWREQQQLAARQVVVAVGSLDDEWAAAAILLFGTIMGSWPDKLACLWWWVT